MKENTAESKKETTEKLWGIRAGLSHISEKTDVYIAREEKIKENDELIEKRQKRIAKDDAIIDHFKKKVKPKAENQILDYQNKIKQFTCLDVGTFDLDKYNSNDYYGYGREVVNSRIEYKGQSTRFVLSLLGTIALFILMIIFFANRINGAGVGVGGGFALIYTFVCLYKMKKNKEIFEKEKKDLVAITKGYIKNANDDLEFEKGTRDRAIEDSKALKEEIGEMETENENLRSENEELRNKINLEFQALSDTYGEFLSVADWQHIDVILFNLTSGRADDLKEALNILDQRLNAKMIAEEIKNATVKIESAIQLGSEEIVAGVDECARVFSCNLATISERSAEMTIELQKAQAATNKLIAENAALNERTITAQELGNALQKKANATMQQMMRDYEFVNRNSGVHQSL